MEISYSRISGFVLIFRVVHGRFRSVYRLKNERHRFHQPRAEWDIHLIFLELPLLTPHVATLTPQCLTSASGLRRIFKRSNPLVSQVNAMRKQGTCNNVSPPKCETHRTPERNQVRYDGDDENRSKDTLSTQRDRIRRRA